MMAGDQLIRWVYLFDGVLIGISIVYISLQPQIKSTPAI
jgi:hypothetical protein